jgi:hypothetical protein
MVQTLLKHGANPIHCYKNTTIWARFVETVLQQQRPVTGFEVTLIRLLLHNGANTRLQIKNLSGDANESLSELLLANFAGEEISELMKAIAQALSRREEENARCCDIIDALFNYFR